MNARTLIRRICTLIAACAALALAAPSAASDVRFQMPDGDVYANIPFTIYIRVIDSADQNAPKVPDMPGTKVQIQIPSRHTSMVFRNGKQTATFTTVYAIEITPERAGRLDIPQISIDVDGTTYRSQPTYVEVKKGEASDVFDAEIFGTPPEVYIGQPLELVLRIGIKPFRDPSLIVLSESQMWQLVELQTSDLGIFAPALQRMAEQRRETPPVQTETRNGATWYVYEIACTIWPPKSGAPDLGRVALKMNYPVSLREVPGVINNRLFIDGTRPVMAEAKVNPLTVLPIPEKGRPAGYTGAVGQFAIVASAKPMTAAVGDPISLTLVVIDRTPNGAHLETLQPPLLSEIPELKRNFRVPTEPLSGTPSTSRKTFVQTIRPLRTDVTEIPAIPFSFFDPVSREYKVVTTDPIAITVTPAAQMDLSQIQRANGAAETDIGAPTTHLTEVEKGLMANKPVSPRLLANEQLRWSALTLAGVCGPPAVVGLAALWRLNRTRHERDTGLARRSRARRTAERRLNAASDASGVARAVAGFVEDRLGRSEGTMTRGDLHAALQAHAVDTAVRDQVVALLSECDRAVYAGTAPAHEASALRARASAALDALDRVAWSRAKGAAA